MRWRRRTATAGRASLLALCICLLATAPAHAKGSTFVLLSGPHIGDLIKTDGGPNVPDKLNRGHTEGVLVPQSNGNQFTFNGKVQAKRDNPPAAAEPLASEPPGVSDLGLAIDEEERAIDSDTGDNAESHLFDAIGYLDTWKQFLDANASALGPTAYNNLVEKYDAANAADQNALVRLGHHSNRVDDAIREGLKAKRSAMETLVGAQLASVISPEVPDPGASYNVQDVLKASFNKLTDHNEITGQSTEGVTPGGAVWNTNGDLISPLDPLTPGQPTNGTAYGPNDLIGGTEGSGANQQCDGWSEDDFAAILFLLHCGIIDGSDLAFVGFTDEQIEEALAFVDDSNKRKRAAGFKKVVIKDFSGGSGLFTVNNKGLAFGDHFLTGESGPFRAFRVKLTKKGHPTTELYRPSGGSSQPKASNDVDLAGGGAVTSGGAVLGTYWWGDKHYTRFKGEGGALINGMNEAGVGVGQINLAGASHAALFEGGVAYDLNDLDISALGGMTLTTATDINNKGQIVGNGMVGGVQHGFELEVAP
jgi:hypothetical protein